ncbi:metal-transporting ATPase [Kineosporia sp. NBRC 101677]|uniref:heavy metal translocating P-type ATPase n=1 Tax=Kineosporia sp. NBRC 101677 TaxID=3032197 RepID=UPI0024A03992|nr:heavy metal translocating P-type ATPase [Kineosporia sp. NBRC 101677]GLY19019.1 metal-transporting ATPase [Kineosporia sp. NBRC 101677]
MPTTAIAPAPNPVPTRPPVVRTRWHALPEMRWAAAALGLFLLGLLAQVSGAPGWLSWALYLSCYAAGGWEPGLAGLQALREKTLDVDLLMVVAAIGAAAIGQVLDGALLIVIFATSGALEALATARTEDSVRGLLELAPETAVRVTEGAEQTVPTAVLAVGDEILVRPGERIGADGEVLSGASDVNQATVTGESLPAEKRPGDEVFAGTLNGTGVLRVQVTRRAGDSVVARIAALVQEASRTKATTQLFVEKVEQRYSVGMVVATLVLFAVPLALGENFREALLRAMTFMIVASPCAIVLSSMPPLLAAVANAGRHGVLIKSAVVMERLGTTSKVAFDKTGTLTQGTPVLAGVRLLGSLDEAEVLRLAAAVEHGSEHPLAKAVVRTARERGLSVPAAVGFAAHPGIGVSATVDGRGVAVRSAAAPGSPAGSRNDSPDDSPNTGNTVVVVELDGEPLAELSFTDRLRPEAPAAIAAVSALTEQPPVLLTGDNADTAADVAARTGIPQTRAGLLPEQKLGLIRQLQHEGERVTFVGDGINDAPALAAAHCGIAMGAASDLTLQTADAVVVRDDLNAIPAVIALSRRARRVVIANLAIAATFITVLVAWDLFGDLPLPLGVLGHEGSTVVVGLNGLRLLREKAWR